MTWKSFRRALLLCLATICACGMPDFRDEPLGEGSARLSAGTQRPLPFDTGTGQVIWDGTAVELVLADVLYECANALDDQGSVVSFAAWLADIDEYIDKIYGLSTAAWTCPGASTWVAKRGTAACNVDPLDITKTQAVELNPVAPTQTIYDPDAPSIPAAWATFDNPQRANRALALPAAYLCMAQRIRSIIPGAAGGESLFLKPQEATELLLAAQGFSQQAILAYGELGLLFLTPPEWTPLQTTQLASRQWVPIVEAWGYDIDMESELRAMSADFATAVQLHLFLTERIATLFARDASSRRPAGGDPVTPAEQDFGRGSWRHRLAAFLYGGAPFGVSDDTPWTNPLGIEGPSQWAPGNPGILDWPSRLNDPFVDANATEPEVERLKGLALEFDELKLARTYQQASQEPNFTAEHKNWLVSTGPTSTRLYKVVEMHIRNKDCTHLINPQNPNTCRTWTYEEIEDPPGDLTGFFAFSKYGITPQHALTLSQYLRGELGPMWEGEGPRDGMGVAAEGDIEWTTVADPGELIGCAKLTSCCGALPPPDDQDCLNWVTIIQGQNPMSEWDDLCNQFIVASNENDPAFCPGYIDPTWIHLKKGIKLHETEISELVPLYQRHVPLRLPQRVWASADTESQGLSLDANISWHTRKAYMGAITALTLSRQFLLDARAYRDNVDQAPNPAPASTGAFLNDLQQTLDLIASAIGDEGIVVRRVFALGEPHPPSAPPIVPSIINEDTENFIVNITAPTIDSFWDDFSSPTVYKLHAVPNWPNLSHLARFPEANYFGEKITTIPLGTPYGISLYQGDILFGGRPVHHVRSGFGATPSGQPDPENDHWVVLAVKPDVMPVPEYRTLADGWVHTPNPMFDESGSYAHSFGGSLGVLFAELTAQSVHNKSKPALDAFGLPTDLVLPTNPNLYIGTGASDPTAHYLLRGKEAAAQATEAVVYALEALVLQDVEDNQAAADEVRAEEMLKLIRDALCGPNNTDCDTSYEYRTAQAGLDLQDNLQFTDCDWSDLSVKEQLHCAVESMSHVITGKAAVAGALGYWLPSPTSTVPTFKEYEGGSLQALFIEQAVAVQQVRQAVVDMRSAYQGALAQVDAAQAQLNLATDQVKEACSLERMDEAFQSGAGASLGFPGGLGMSFSMASVIAQRQACENAAQALPVAEKNYIVAIWAAWAQVTDQMSNLIQRAGQFALTGANLVKALEESRAAEAKLKLELELNERGRTTSSGLYRRYHQYDLFRAEALLASARRYGVLARRAIEARYVLNMSDMAAEEPLVASPKLWADSIYSSDLNMPAVVGLAVPQAQADGIYPNQLVDYMDNLQRFVDGYPVNRPAALAQFDAEVLSFPGPLVVDDDDLVGADVIAWSFFCPDVDDGSWVARSAVPATPATLCTGAPPTHARLVFTLDPWGKLPTQGTFKKRFNARWQRMAVNLVGTAIKDCTTASDPLTCYSSPWVPFNLMHTGPSEVPDYYGALKTLHPPTAFIESGKALAAEQWLDPISNGFSKPYVDQVARNELSDRPFNGTYELEFALSGDVKLDRLERVQVLVGSSYWVQQE